METKYSSLEILKERINDSLTDVTKCYILINYADNTAEEMEMLEEKFISKYNDFYKTIIEVEQVLDNKYMSSDSYKKILNLDFYKESLDSIEIEEIETEDLDIIYNKKANNSNTRLNFYYNNKSEFGPSTRFHVETTKNGLINPRAKDEKERKYIFNTLIEYYNKKYLNTSKKYVKSM